MTGGADDPHSGAAIPRALAAGDWSDPEPHDLGVGLRAVVLQVEARHRRQPVQPGGECRLGQPGGEEPRSLGALAGRDDREHGFTLS